MSLRLVVTLAGTVVLINAGVTVAQAQEIGLPAGIAVPAWGNLDPIQAQAPEWPDAWPSSEVPGYFYVDSGSPAATDSNNAYGYPARPRVTIPEIDYPAGSYVEIRGGPYRGGGQIIFTAHGTEQSPVWIRGSSNAEKAVIRGEMLVKGSYIFLENLRFDSNNTLGLRPHNRSTLHHAVVRQCLFDGPGTDAGHHSAIAISGLPGPMRYSDILVIDNQIHDFGDRDSESENDFHGIAVGVNVDRVWILNNDIHDLAGDSVQVGTVSATDDRRVDNIFIGGNRFHNNRENAVDIKSSSNVVVSGNTMYGFATSSTSGGAAVVVHYNPENVWILGNTISQSEHGIVSTGSQNLWIVSNIVFAIHHAQQVWQPERVYARGSAIHFRGTTSGGVVNNTFYEYDIGIQLARGASGYRIVNNLFVNRSRAEGYDIITTDPVVASKSTLDHLAFRLSADERIFWRNRTYTANQLRKAHPGLCKRCIVSDETLLVDPADNNFSPRRDAPIVDAGAAMDDIPGISAANSDNLAFDALGQPRRTGASVDIGAVELMQ